MLETSRLTAADKQHFVAPETASPEHQCAVAERRRIVQACLQRLQPQQARLIVLRYEHGWTLLRIAQEFDVVESAVHAMHNRVLRRLRAELGAGGIESLGEIL